MSADTFTEVTDQSWFSRIGGSIKGVLVGLILFVAAFPVLFWNEGRAVKTARSLTEGAAAVIEVSADAPDPGNEGKLVVAILPDSGERYLSSPLFEGRFSDAETVQATISK